MVTLRLAGCQHRGLKTDGDAHESGGGEHRKDIISGAKGDLLLSSPQRISAVF